ncbi:hypothetical protein T12_13907 [Trichinella patagoniensis]|uniref:Uncharacterized protein n=1 Tax=Trichinella patagoniensis TaxID=990121 RepID=A0A0V0ZPY6_9BILA|nr:hypothetical protein T12_13907 [Trichinella patagoniensis]
MLYLIFLSSKAQRILKQEGFNGTIVLDTLQSSAVISDVIFNMKTISQSSKATPVDMFQVTPSGMPQAVPQATPQGMLGATPPAILFSNFDFSNNLPQATPPASPQAIFKKIIALRPRPKAISKNYLPLGHAYGNFKKLFALRPRPKAISKNYLPLGHAYGNFKKTICLVDIGDKQALSKPFLENFNEQPASISDVLQLHTEKKCFNSADCCWRSTLHNTYLKAQRILKQEGFNGTIVLDTLQSSAVISDVIFNMKTISQSSKATPVDMFQVTPSGMPQAVPQATPQGMLGATPPAILFSNFDFSNNLPQATPPASPQAIFKKIIALRPRPKAISKNYLPLGHAYGNFKKLFALRPRPKAISKNYLPLGHAYGNFKKTICLVGMPQAIFQKNMPFSYTGGYASGSFEICR